MEKFTHIDQFYQVVKLSRNRVFGDIDYRGSVKLHGSNAGVICTKEKLIPQSRNRQLSILKDNMGFASFALKRESQIRNIEQKIRKSANLDSNSPLALYGEFIGSGIQNGVAVSKFSERQWVLFAVKAPEKGYIDELFPFEDEFSEFSMYSVFDVPTWKINLDFNDKDDLEEKSKVIEIYTQKVEELCPWGNKFGISGMGEGIVWVPTGNRWGDTRLFFKTKGLKHKVVKKANRNKSIIDPEIIENSNKFVEYAVTENRLNQGIDYLKEMDYSIEMKSTGHFLKWIANDIMRECKQELVENDLSWKQVAKQVNERARIFFVSKAKE